MTTTDTPAAARNGRRRWMTLGVLSSGYFVEQGESQALSVLHPAIRQTLNIGYGELGRSRAGGISCNRSVHPSA